MCISGLRKENPGHSLLSLVRYWTPRDPKEKPREVLILGLIVRQGRTVGALIRETKGKLPGVAMVSLAELGKPRGRPET
jgi:hypothetical protein